MELSKARIIDILTDGIAVCGIVISFIGIVEGYVSPEVGLTLGTISLGMGKAGSLLEKVVDALKGLSSFDEENTN